MKRIFRTGKYTLEIQNTHKIGKVLLQMFLELMLENIQINGEVIVYVKICNHMSELR